MYFVITSASKLSIKMQLLNPMYILLFQGKQYDEERTAFLEEYGLTVIRIPNTEIHKNFRGVCEYIDHLVEQSLSQLR